MTPLALKTARQLLTSGGERSFLTQLLASACFDLSPVGGIVRETGQELLGTLAAEHRLEHGGLLFAPAGSSWIEMMMPGLPRIGALVWSEENVIWFESATRDVSGFLELDEDGEHFSSGRNGAIKSTGPDYDMALGVLASFVASALLLINAPRGVERHASPPHKGLAREVRRAGFGELKPVHTIRLAKRSGHVGEPEPAGQGSPKAFHFCRSHLRKLPNGEITRIRAHWRGDPALGVRQGDYLVSGPPKPTTGRA
jgi:hypothetical protein